MNLFLKISYILVTLTTLSACGGSNDESNNNNAVNNIAALNTNQTNGGALTQQTLPQQTPVPAMINTDKPAATQTPAPLIERPSPIITPKATAIPIATPTPTPVPSATPQTSGIEDNIDAALEGELANTEQQLTSGALLAEVKRSIATIDNARVDAITVGNQGNPKNVQRVEGIISRDDWEFLFPKRAVEYTYENFLKAVGKFPALCGDYLDGRDADTICRKTLATMFAHFAQETGGHSAHWDVPEWRQALVYVREMGWNENMRGGYNSECNLDVWQGQTWPCGTFDNGDFKSYFGRGAKQLSYNYNYGPFSQAMFGDVSVLLDQPELVADTWLNLASAIFFYVYPQPPKPSMLHVVDGTWQPNTEDIANGLTPGFGVTTQIINGGVECGGSSEIAQSQNRIEYYHSFADYLNVTIAPDEVLGCAGMKQFTDTGAGALNIYWEQDWSYVAENPEGKSLACQLVGYQTAFSAFLDGDYSKCVKHFFGDELNVAEATDNSSNDNTDSTPISVQQATPAPVIDNSNTTDSQPVPLATAAPQSDTPSAPNEITATTPATISIAWLDSTYDGDTKTLTVSWNMYWGNNGDFWRAYVDDIIVASATLIPANSNAQSGKFQTTISGVGEHTIVVELCNGGSTSNRCSRDSKTVTLINNTGDTIKGTNENTTADTSSDDVSLPSAFTRHNEYNKTYQQDSGKVVVSYFVEWGIYGRDYHVQDIPASNLTHVLFGFLAICGDNPHASGGAQAAIASECANKQDYEVTQVDRFANLEKTYPGDTWSDDTSGQNYNGSFNQLRKLKATNPHLKILPSIGGWTMSTPFYALAKDDNKRAIFVASAIAFIKKYDFFDGLDIDWEYPVYGGTDPQLSTPADRQGYSDLMRDLRQALDNLSLTTGRDYELTTAVGAAPQKIDAIDYVEASTYLNYVFLMSYDFMGAWANTTGHHANLYDNNGLYQGFSGAAAVHNLLDAGVPHQKIVLGAAFYGRGWAGTQNNGSDADLFPLYGEATGPAKGTWENGVLDYRDLYDNYIGTNNRGINGFDVIYDDIAEAPYLWNASTGEFISYESPRSIQAKTDLVNQLNLGGMLSWEIDADNGLLLNAINEGLGNSEIK